MIDVNLRRPWVFNAKYNLLDRETSTHNDIKPLVQGYAKSIWTPMTITGDTLVGRSTSSSPANNRKGRSIRLGGPEIVILGCMMGKDYACVLL